MVFLFIYFIKSGMIDNFTGELRIELCPGNRRNEATLRPLIEKHVQGLTRIVTDEWLAYGNLNHPNPVTGVYYNHETVNHSVEFVNATTGANTQRIESNWRSLKQRVCRGGVHKEYLADHLCEYLWFRRCKMLHLDSFSEFIKAVVRLHPFN